MNLDQELFLAYVEQDNIQRAYFRVHPVLTVNGPAAEEGRALWPDDGCLRIVPDRGEHHTFKERMRQLNGWCVVDLTAFLPDANKIRSNKNYHPDKGETNHFILYSDTVRSVADRIFHQVFSGKPQEAAALAASSVTPSFFIRDEDMIYGPISREKVEEPTAAPAMEARFFQVDCPDGVSRDFICVQAEYDARPKSQPVDRLPRKKKEKAPRLPAEAAGQTPVQPEAPVSAEHDIVTAEAKPDAEHHAAPAAASDEVLPVGQSLKILDEKQTYEETISQLNAPVSEQANLLKRNASFAAIEKPAEAVHQDQAKLNGTPLRRPAAPQLQTQPRNKVQQVVYNQVRVIRNDPPALDLPDAAALATAHNPVEHADQAFRDAWQVRDARDRLLESILSLDGIESALERRMSRRIGVTNLQHAIHEHISTLQAERLKVLVELNEAKTDLETYRQSVIASARQKLQNELTALDEKKAAAEQALAALKDEVNQLSTLCEALAQRKEQLEKEAIPEAVARMFADRAISMPMCEPSIRLVSACGETVDSEHMVNRLMKVFRFCGLQLTRNHAVAALLCLALNKRIGITCKAQAAAVTLMQNIAVVMGWESSFAVQSSSTQHVAAAKAALDGTPALLVSAMPECAPSDRFIRLIVSDQAAAQSKSSAYQMNQWPILPLNIDAHIPTYHENDVKPVAAQSLADMTKVSGIADNEIDKVMGPALSLVQPLSGEAMAQLRCFVRAAASLMEGGLVTACDFAVQLWIMPALTVTDENQQAVRVTLTEYPISHAMLG